MLESDSSLDPGSARLTGVILDKLSNPTDPWVPHRSNEDTTHLKEIKQNTLLC